MNILKILLLPVIAFFIKENYCQSMESINYNCEDNKTLEKNILEFNEQDYEDKKSQNNYNEIIDNNEEQYKHIFDKKHNEEYYEEIEQKCYNKYKNDKEYNRIIQEIRNLCNEIYSLYLEYDSEYYKSCCYQTYQSFYETISYIDEPSKEKNIATGDLVKVINYSELMKYAQLFDSFSFENKFNNKLLSNNNVENLNKYMSENKESNEISYLKFIHYMANNTKKLEAQLLEMIYNNQLNSSNYIVLKQYSKIIHNVIDGLKHFTNIANEKYNEKYKEKYKRDFLHVYENIPVRENSLKNYNINKLYFKFKLQNNDVYNQIKELVNDFNTLHNKIIYDLNKTILDIYNHKIPNDFVTYKFMYFRGNYDFSNDFLKSFTFLKEYIRNSLFTFDNISNRQPLIIFTSLGEYLYQLIISFNQLKKFISIDMQINIDNMYKNNVVDIFYFINNVFFYVDTVTDIFKNLRNHFPGNKSLSFEKCMSTLEDFCKLYSKYPSIRNEGHFVLINDED